MATKFQPLNGFVLIKPLGNQERSAAGLYIPEQAQKKSSQGFVVAAAEDVTGVHIGESVMFSEYGGLPLMLDGAEYRIIKSTELLGIVR